MSTTTGTLPAPTATAATIQRAKVRAWVIASLLRAPARSDRQFELSTPKGRSR